MTLHPYIAFRSLLSYDWQVLHRYNAAYVPGLNKKRIETAKGELLYEAFQWILTNDGFQSWRDTEENRLLWIKGDPGKGKTMLLCSLINDLERCKDNIVYYFFFQATDMRIFSGTAML